METSINQTLQVVRSSMLLIVMMMMMSGDIMHVTGVVVDGKRSGPSAKKNQQREDESIDGYNTKSCGISDIDKEKSAFVNSAREGEFPWLSSFQILKKDKSYAHFCMGSFISDRWILSAAHCFADP